MTINDDILDLKRPYRKKALQTGYSQSGPSVVSMASEWTFMRPQTVWASSMVSQGRWGYLPLLTWNTFTRGLLSIPGLWVVGIREWKPLLLYAMAANISLSVGLVGYFVFNPNIAQAQPYGDGNSGSKQQ